MVKILGGSVLKIKVIVISGVIVSGKMIFINVLFDIVENVYVFLFDDYSIDVLLLVLFYVFLLKNFNVVVNLFDII